MAQQPARSRPPALAATATAPVFTAFRQAIESAGLQPAAPLPSPTALPPWPPGLPGQCTDAPAQALAALAGSVPAADGRSAFPYLQHGLHGGEAAALAHLAQYLARHLPHSYKRTRNGLLGLDFSSKWSPWLATGALSPRQAWRSCGSSRPCTAPAMAATGCGSSCCGATISAAAPAARPRTVPVARAGPVRATPHDGRRFAAWCAGQTGQPLVDAAMRELAATGYLGNRLRQVAASYLIHDLGCDWRAGAAWFEAQLLDYDVYSNQGNWLYIAGGAPTRAAARALIPCDRPPPGIPREPTGAGGGQHDTLHPRAAPWPARTLRLVLGDQLNPGTAGSSRWTRRWSMC
jgi:deoxyribodipyrimidine photo-lyase